MTQDTDDKEFKPSPSIERAQNLTQDFLKLLVSLSSAVLALSATFVTKFYENSGPFLCIILLAWVSLSTSIYFGVNALIILTRNILNDNEEWWRITLRPARWCWRCFILGICCIAIFAGTIFIKHSIEDTDRPLNKRVTIESDSVFVKIIPIEHTTKQDQTKKQNTEQSAEIDDKQTDAPHQ